MAYVVALAAVLAVLLHERRPALQPPPFITAKYRMLRQQYTPPKYPIVLCHGLSGFDTLTLLKLPQAKVYGPDDTGTDPDPWEGLEAPAIMVDYWHGIEKALTKIGAKVVVARVPAFGSIADRARQLDAVLRKEFADHPGRAKINIVGHSMGGLDLRYLISQIQSPDLPYEVVLLTTVGSPHHGLEVADFIMEATTGDSVWAKALPQAIPQLTTSYMEHFNQVVRDSPGVRYFSYGALMDPAGFRLFRPTYEIIKRACLRAGRPVANDGMVSVDLAKWGTYVGTLDGVDHLDLINWTNTVKAAVNTMVFQETPQFNPVALYLDIADTLSKEGL